MSNKNERLIPGIKILISFFSAIVLVCTSLALSQIGVDIKGIGINQTIENLLITNNGIESLSINVSDFVCDGKNCICHIYQRNLIDEDLRVKDIFTKQELEDFRDNYIKDRIVKYAIQKNLEIQRKENEVIKTKRVNIISGE